MTRAGAKGHRLYRKNYDQDPKLQQGKPQKYYSNVRGDTVVQDAPTQTEAEEWRRMRNFGSLYGRNLFNTHTQGAHNDTQSENTTSEPLLEFWHDTQNQNTASEPLLEFWHP